MNSSPRWLISVFVTPVLALDWLLALFSFFLLLLSHSFQFLKPPRKLTHINSGFLHLFWFGKHDFLQGNNHSNLFHFLYKIFPTPHANQPIPFSLNNGLILINQEEQFFDRFGKDFILDNIFARLVVTIIFMKLTGFFSEYVIGRLFGLGWSGLWGWIRLGGWWFWERILGCLGD